MSNHEPWKTTEREKAFNILNGLRGNRVVAIVVIIAFVLVIVACVLVVQFGLRLGQLGIGA